MLMSLMEASGNLVVPAVFKTDVADSLGQAGSIPVRLLHPLRNAHSTANPATATRSLTCRSPASRLPTAPKPGVAPCSVTTYLSAGRAMLPS